MIMKRIFFTLCLIFFVAMTVNAGELYRCKDSHGNIIVTDNPQNGMKCDYFDTESQSEVPVPPESKKAGEKDDDAAASAKKSKDDLVKRINKCIRCCNGKIDACYNYTADPRLCMAENQSCVSMCKSEGSSPSSWSDCWSQSE